MARTEKQVHPTGWQTRPPTEYKKENQRMNETAMDQLESFAEEREVLVEQ